MVLTPFESETLTMKINKITSSSTIDYAAEELKKYIRMMMPEGGDIKIAFNPTAADGFRLGLMQDFGLDVSDADDTELDDIIYIDCDEQGGIIAGDNPRSVLLAVYEYLRQNGCRWFMPGVDGEYIPLANISPVKYRHKADSRIRGNCLEGYVSQNVVLQYVDFMPKMGLNTFMIQFKVPGTHYNRYYNHWHNEANRSAEPASKHQIMQWATAVECELAKRGIMLHACGHGFTTDPFGIDSANGWSKVDCNNYSEEIMKYYAMIGGERKFYRDQPMNTQICMTNVEARKKIVDYVVEYAKKHTNIDYLHVWLADDYNNHCECKECSKHRPSDLYVKLMNEVDDALTAAGVDTKIVVIVYVDTFWAPVVEKLHTGNRFILMVAPIMRDYTLGFDPASGLPPLRPYERNKLKMPETFEENIAYYHEWKKCYSGSRFVFEYHFWKHQHFDLSGKMLAKRIFDDVHAYRSLGEDGILQCGSQRSFFPNGFAFYTHARSLFDASLTIDEIERDYFSHTYGNAADKISAVLDKLYDALPYDYISPDHAKKRECGYATPDAKERMERARRATEELKLLVQENYNSDIRLRTKAIRVLEYYCSYLEKLIDVLDNLSRGDKSATEAAMAEFKRNGGAIEAYIEDYYDHGQASEMLEYRILRLFNT